MTRKKFQRNCVYVSSGLIIVVCLIGIGVIQFALPAELKSKFLNLHAVFWLESLAVWAFSFAWLAKGQAILKDL
jgi:hypothetical protein